MSNIEKSRSDLDKKLSKLGYVHPKTHQQANNHGYYTINVKDKKGSYKPSKKNHNPYKSFTGKMDEEKGNISTKQKSDICPMCGEKALYRCECKEYRDMMCKNKHVWWYTVNGQLIKGDPHFNEED